MLCNRVSKLLSEYYDGVLDDEKMFQVSRHLKQCERCRKELNRLSIVHDRLNSMGKIQAPDYLYHLIQNRLWDKNQNTWYHRIQDALSLQWSRIRTTEVRFYWTRALGTIMATLFFCMISSGIDPFYSGYGSQLTGRSVILPEYSEQVRMSVSRQFGVFPIELYKKRESYDSALHDQYLIEFGESVSSEMEEDAFTVVTEVDPSGTAKIQNIIESPYDRDLLNSFENAIALARFRPASRNGRLVSSKLVLKFSKISVYD